ncbi:MAG: hypothetical protein GY809_06285 [Planctomycetes bacterium]|nr:hypothetical protein [Planctomycetota bacterium]
MKKTETMKKVSAHPHRLALAGGWGDHNFVNFLAPGNVVVVQIEPEVSFHDRCGLCSSTRKILVDKYPKGVPENIDRYKLATDLYYWENATKAPIGGSQDAWGSVYPGINLLHYDFRHHNGVLPETVTSIINQRTARWFERNFWVVECVGPRPQGYNPFDGGRFATKRVVSQLGQSGEDCFSAIKHRDAAALGASFNQCSSAWKTMLPAIFEHPTIKVPVMKQLRYYQRKYAGAMPSGCGVGYIYVASSEPVEGGFQVKVNLS